jgi:lycopene cyclase domain-containing protein
MSWLYLAANVVSALCVGLLDHRWRLFLFARPGRVRRAVLVLVAGAAFFLVWDLVAIAHGMYERGDSPGMTGIEVADELPLEEVFFVVFFAYVTMVAHGAATLALVRRAAPRTAGRPAGSAEARR